MGKIVVLIFQIIVILFFHVTGFLVSLGFISESINHNGKYNHHPNQFWLTSVYKSGYNLGAMASIWANDPVATLDYEVKE